MAAALNVARRHGPTKAEWQETGKLVGCMRAQSLETSGLDAATVDFIKSRLRGSLVVPIGAVHDLFLQLGQHLLKRSIAELTANSTWERITGTMTRMLPKTLPIGSPTFSSQVSCLSNDSTPSLTHSPLPGLLLRSERNHQVLSEDLHERLPLSSHVCLSSKEKWVSTIRICSLHERPARGGREGADAAWGGQKEGTRSSAGPHCLCRDRQCTVL